MPKIFSLEKPTKEKKQLPLPVIVFLGVFVGIIAALGIYTAIVVNTLKTQATAAEESARKTYAVFKTQNLPLAQEELTKLKTQVDELHTTYQKLSLYNYVPV